MPEMMAAMMTRGMAAMISQILTLANCRALRWSLASSLSSPLVRFWNSLTALQAAAVVSAFVLTIGAVIEYWDKLKLLAVLMLKWILRKSTPFDRCILKKLLFHSMGPILVVLGIAGEVIFEGRTFVVEDRQEEQARQIVGSLGDKAEEADRKAKAAIADSSTALSQAKDALRLANETIEIEEAHARRNLSDRQISEIGQALKVFTDRSAVLTFPQGDSEAEDFTGQIRAALHKAEWHGLASSAQVEMHFTGPEPSPSQPVPSMPPLMGVFISYKIEWSSPGQRLSADRIRENSLRRKAAEAVACELSKRGFDAIPAPDVVGVLIVSDTYVRVGHRPKGSQGDAKLRHEKKSTKQVKCQ